MTSAWIDRLPLSPIKLAYLVLLLYFGVHRQSSLAWFLLVFSLLFLWRHGRAVVTKTLMMLLAFFAFFSYPNWRAEQGYQESPKQVNQLLILPDTIMVNGDSLSFQAQTQGQIVQVFYRLTSQEEQEFFKNLFQPVQLSVEAQVSEAEERGNFKGFDYRDYLRTKGIYRQVRIENITGIQVASKSNPRLWLRGLRRRALVHIDRTFPAPLKHYLTGLLFGYLGKDFGEMRQIYSSLGVIHLFALSGMHVSFFVQGFRRILLRLGLTHGQVDVCQLPFSWLYAGLTGFHVSVIRSLFQAGYGRLEVKGLDNLGLTLLTVLLFFPNSLLTVGGVLSFSYAFILALMSGDSDAGYLARIKQGAALSLAVLPLLIWYFSTYQPWAMLLTIGLSVLFQSLLLPMLCLVFLISSILPLTVFNLPFIWLDKGLTWLNHVLGRPWIFGSPNLLILVAILFCLGLLYDYGRKKQYRLPLIIALALLFFITKHPLENEVTVVNVGQGDSIFLRDVRGRNLLIDTGGRVIFGEQEEWRKRESTSNAEQTLVPYLKSRGVGRIDQLLITHTDTDHMGDMEILAQQFRIGEILVSEGSMTNPRFVERLRAMGIPVRLVTAGDSLPIMGSRLQVLYPWEQGDGSNNDSIVLYGRLLGTNFLFTGDLEEGELELVKRYPNLPVDVLKAGHHGSKGSSYPEFLHHIGADIALVSAGVNNRYNHPHQETLDRFEEVNMTVYRTDEQGAIRFRGLREWTVETVRE